MKTIATAAVAIMMCAARAWAGGVGDSVEVRVVTDDGRTLSTYPVKTQHALHKVYAEAVKGDHYRIEVQNHLNRRVGLVIAVDGRNIINGKRSWMKSSEQMYVLEPYGTGEFSGWRTGRDKINRFYFTSVPDSYAAAFGDESAMGLITVAAFPEVVRYKPPPRTYYQNTPSKPRGPWSVDDAPADRMEAASGAAKAKGASAAPAAEAKRAMDKADRSMEGAGTGYGHEEYSHVETVEFQPEKHAVEKVFIKYEWRATLCALRVLSCDQPPRRPQNRLWDNDGFAPPPPGRS